VKSARLTLAAAAVSVVVSGCSSSTPGPGSASPSESPSVAVSSSSANAATPKPTGTLPAYRGTVDGLCSFDGGGSEGPPTANPASLVLTFVGAIIGGTADAARSCVYPNTVPPSEVNALAAKTLVQHPSCLQCLKFVSSTKSTSHFVLRHEATTFDVTVAQDTAGSYWVTAITVSPEPR
jgi:hypothetical protein